MMSRVRWLGGWGLLVATYLGLALRHAIADDPGSGSIAAYLVAAAVTGVIAIATVPIMAPKGRRRGDQPDDGGDGPGGGGGDDPPPPPWWPEFERQFRCHLHGLGPVPRDRDEQHERTSV